MIGTLGTAVPLKIEDASQVGEARRAANALAARLGAGETERGTLALVVTEAATNLVRHADGGGTLLLQPLDRAGQPWVDVLALDRGPGMSSVPDALRDGYSTAGTAGEGLGAIRRLSREFDLYSAPGLGTALFARVALRLANFDDDPPGTPGFTFGAVSVPLPGEEVCGDDWAADGLDGDAPRFLVADGLGHGAGAAEASGEAVRVFAAPGAETLTPAALLERAHGALRHTRGAAAASAQVAPGGGAVTFAGVGNIQAAFVNGSGGAAAKGLASHNGTVGHQARKFADFVYDWPPGALLILASDGVTTQWGLERYPGLLARHPAVVAGVVYRDCARGRDDATVLAVAAGGRRGGC